MPHRVEDDWSDSDDEGGGDVETNVLLGVPDGPITDERELADAAVSRIGGRPAFLTSNPPAEAAKCKICDQTMKLLVQLWAPMEDSPLDRAVYVWACSQSACQRKEGSVRIWRNVRVNKKYAAQLERRKKREQQANSKPVEPPKPSAPMANPFAMTGSGPAGTFGGLGSQIFGAAPVPPPVTAEPDTHQETESNGPKDSIAKDDDASDDELVIALAATTLDDSSWSDVPAYPPLYLSTCPEYVPPPPKAKLPKGIDPNDPDASSNDKGGGFAPEGYENSLETDHVFDRFSNRVAHEPEQCIRYELDGTPLPFSSDTVFDRIFPAPKSNVTVIGKDLSSSALPKRTYNSASIPPCPRCSGKRAFEFQLMPNLINVVRRDDGEKETYASEEQRVEAVRASLQKGSSNGQGMEWGTCLVFSCAGDCHSGEEVFTEEEVLVQWED